MRVPDVTVVIPTYGRPAALRACLEGIAGLAYDHTRLEVIVVDDGGPDRLEPVLTAFRDRIPLRLITQRNGGPGAARNAGAATATARFLAFIDDDCVPAAAWLSALVHELDAHPDRLLGGPVVNALPDNPFSTASQLLATYVARCCVDGRANEQFFTTNNLALSTDRFRELGGFDTSIPSATAEDKEFCDRWRERGYEMAWVPAALVHHAHDLTFRRFLRQHYNYGRGILCFRLMRRRRTAGRLVPESLSFYLRLVLYPLRIHPRRRSWQSVLLLVLAQLATGAGALKATLTERPRRHVRSATRLHGVPGTGA